jgi:hypothetical protein
MVDALVAGISQILLLIWFFRKLGAVPYGRDPDSLSFYSVQKPIRSSNNLSKW